MVWAKWVMLVLSIAGFSINLVKWGEPDVSTYGGVRFVSQIIAIALLYFAGALPF